MVGEINLFDFVPTGGAQEDLVGGALAMSTTGTTLTPVKMVHHVTGAGGGIGTITPPWEGFTGPLYLVADSAFVVTTSGNIQIAFTATAGQAYGLLYDRKTSKWYKL